DDERAEGVGAARAAAEIDAVGRAARDVDVAGGVRREAGEGDDAAEGVGGLGPAGDGRAVGQDFVDVADVGQIHIARAVYCQPALPDPHAGGVDGREAGDP